MSIFKKELGKNLIFLTLLENIVLNLKNNKILNFKYAFGQHSGVMDETKDFYEFPRFPINEKYGEIKDLSL